jgi:leucyl aminopeptidase
VPLEFRVVDTPPARVAADLLAVPVGTDGASGPGVDAVDDALGGGLSEFMEEAAFEGKPGQMLAVPTRGRLGAAAAVVVGVGKLEELTVDSLRRAAATVARRASKVSAVATTLVDLGDRAGIERADAARAVVEGAVLGSYRFLKYKGADEPSRLERFVILGRKGARVDEAVRVGSAVADAVVWARDIVNEPSGEKPPAAFADAAKRRLRGAGVTVQVLSGAQLEAERLGGILGVGQGSAQKPRLVKLRYSPPGATATLALVGKGVVFDSGGLSIKTAAGMETMKTDMSGAAAVIAAMSVLRVAGVKARVLGYVPMVENMPSGTAIRPGDVLTIRNGKTVEVLNTDAEGRLILADGLSLAAEEQPDAVVDIATLTGACVVALGDKVAGLMGNNDDLIAAVRAAADRVGEAVWPLPLPSDYRKLIDSEVADVANVSGGRYAGALTAGLFLAEFVDDVPWAHLDIAGPARAGSDDGYVVKGGTGFGVRTLVELALNFKAPKRARKVSDQPSTRRPVRRAAGTGRRTRR